jgi:hypothetical protein
MRGAAFLEGTGLHGNEIIVKGARVETITDWSSESIQSWIADRSAEVRETKKAEEAEDFG